jgi:CheY-like chemotaxis protein
MEAMLRKILILEDDPLIALMLEEFLEALGWQVAAVTDNVTAALRII